MLEKCSKENAELQLNNRTLQHQLDNKEDCLKELTNENQRLHSRGLSSEQLQKTVVLYMQPSVKTSVGYSSTTSTSIPSEVPVVTTQSSSLEGPVTTVQPNSQISSRQLPDSSKLGASSPKNNSEPEHNGADWHMKSSYPIENKEDFRKQEQQQKTGVVDKSLADLRTENRQMSLEDAENVQFSPASHRTSPAFNSQLDIQHTPIYQTCVSLATTPCTDIFRDSQSEPPVTPQPVAYHRLKGSSDRTQHAATRSHLNVIGLC